MEPPQSALYQDLASQFQTPQRTHALYASSCDEALVYSKTVNVHIRVGDTAVGITIAPDVDTIDVSGVDTSSLGHSYYADNRSIISCLDYLIRGVQLRFGLQQKIFNGHASRYRPTGNAEFAEALAWR
jgi:hypothetical protein